MKPNSLPSSTPVRPLLPSGVPPTELRRRTLPSALSNQSASLGPPSSLSAESLSTAAGQRSQFLPGTPMPMHRPSVNGQGYNPDHRKFPFFCHSESYFNSENSYILMKNFLF